METIILRDGAVGGGGGKRGRHGPFLTVGTGLQIPLKGV